MNIRRTRAKRFLERLGDEELRNAIGHLNMYLQACPLEETPLVAVLILHIDLLVGVVSDRYSNYVLVEI